MDTKKVASDCYRKGVQAVDKQNWDLAVEMFGMCVRFIPDNVGYRQLLRNSQYKKYNENKTGAGAFAKSKLLGIRNRIKKAKAKEEWEEVDKACEEGLALNPWDIQLNVDLAEAAKAREFSEVARFAYLQARNIEPSNKQLNWQLAEILEERGEYDEAAGIWQHICKLDPLDGNARSKLTGAHTKKTMHSGGYENADSTRQVMAGRNPKSGELAAPGESQEADLKHAIRKDPQKIEGYLKLGDHYKRAGLLDEAHKTLESALQVSGNNPNVREQLEDIELLRMNKNVEIARERAAEGDEDARNQARELAMEYAKRRLEVLNRRVERYPQDLVLKFELAELLMSSYFGKFTQAIPLLQQASQNKRLKARALIKLGRCFIADKKIALARGQIERGVAEVNAPEDPKLFVEAHYMLGVVCETLKDFPAAEKHFGEVLVVDYDYKDALARLEKLQGGGDKPE